MTLITRAGSSAHASWQGAHTAAGGRASPSVERVPLALAVAEGIRQHQARVAHGSEGTPRLAEVGAGASPTTAAALGSSLEVCVSFDAISQLAVPWVHVCEALGLPPGTEK